MMVLGFNLVPFVGIMTMVLANVTMVLGFNGDDGPRLQSGALSLNCDDGPL